MKISDHIEVVPQPTVVRLDQLQDAESAWISQSYYITEETEKHFSALRALLAKETGCGMFLIGHYGSGKSHFLAYLTRQLQTGSFAAQNPSVLPLSLLNFQAAQSLESILDQALGIKSENFDRRKMWSQIGKQHPGGLFLVLDELSEFLRSKPTTQSFNEDLRFLQFLGEWSQGHYLWILAALQEQIEHTGDMEFDLYRKIKDRYPVRFLLTPTHVKDLIAQRILRKKPSYRPAVEKLAKELIEVYPDNSIDYADFCEIYPLHPTTLELLEEVRDRFSQARGIIDFTLTQLLGNEVRGTEPFLDQPWGHLITPDRIVDHFADLFEVQPEFLAIAQKVLPYYRKQIPVLFDRKLQQALAWRLLKLLILVYLSPRRKLLSVEEAARWLLFKVSSVDPARNRQVVKRVIDTMVQQGAFLRRQNERYCLDLEEDAGINLDQILSRTVEELKGRGDAVFETLVPLLVQAEFNPFSLPRDRWHTRRIRWCFHEREIQVYFGGGKPPEPNGLALQIGLPWGPPAEGLRCYKILPAAFEPTPDVLELAALQQLKERPLPARILARIQERIAGRTSWFCSLIRTAYNEAAVIDSTGSRAVSPLGSRQGGFTHWLNAYGEWILRQTYPMFERFAPGYGPLPKEAYRQFMKYAAEHDLGSEAAPDFVKLMREAYLVPMGLMQRRGQEYMMNQKLDRHELVLLLTPILDHYPTPARVYEHLSAPVYGLVQDQIHLLLLILLIQGEIDILKGQHSYRETYETLGNPLQYDKVVPGRALSLSQLRDLQLLCEGFHIPVPKQWSVLAQKRAIEQLRKLGGQQRGQLSDFMLKLRSHGEAEDLVAQIERIISQWLGLEKGDHELQAFQHFAFAIASPHRFVAEAGAMMSLPARFEKLLRESQRFRHLFGYPCIAQCPNPNIVAKLEVLRQPPPLAQSEALETWLDHAQSFYLEYQDWYRKEHEEWRNATGLHPIWSYQIPQLARSKHLAVAGAVHNLEALQARARRERCSGLSALEFQPVCRCGFDGQVGPLAATLQEFEAAAKQLEGEMALFFQQDKVKANVREWMEQKFELNPQTLSYLEGKAAYPATANLSLFDQHLSGLELVQPVKAGSLLDLLSERIWEKTALMKALDQFFERLGPRIVLRREEPAPKRELLAWCGKQALKQGCALPAVFSPDEHKLLASLIQPQWISEQSLQRIEQMGLGEDAIRRILEMFLDGLIRPPQALPSTGPLAAAIELLNPGQPASTEELARKVSCLYEQNQRFLNLRSQLWLSRMNQLAESNLLHPPEDLSNLLKAHLEAQWIVIDCLGLALLDIVKQMLPDSFANWRIAAVSFGLASRQTSTEAFYRELIAGGLQKSFLKIDGVDSLIHTRELNLAALAKLVRAELEIAFKKAQPELDPARPLLIFGDHGFRLAPDGIGFLHGGPSTLERITPLFVLVPFER